MFAGPDGANAGIGVGPAAGVDGTDNTALSVGINPGDGGTFAGFGVTAGDGVTDVSNTDYLVFSFRPTSVQEGNLPLTLEVNLQEDTDGNGAFDGGGAGRRVPGRVPDRGDGRRLSDGRPSALVVP